MRLTKLHRERIAEAAVANRFAAEHSALDAMERTLADEVIERALGKHAALLDKVPHSWLEPIDSIRVSVDDGSTYVDLELRATRYLPHSFNNCCANFDADDQLGRRIAAYDRERSAIARADKALYRDTLSMLDAFLSDTTLIKRWPEIEPFVRAACGSTEAPSAIAIPISRLNAELGL